MKKLFSLVLAVAMVLSMACFASAEENTTLTIVAWDVGTTPYYQAQKEACECQRIFEPSGNQYLSH